MATAEEVRELVRTYAEEFAEIERLTQEIQAKREAIWDSYSYPSSDGSDLQSRLDHAQAMKIRKEAIERDEKEQLLILEEDLATLTKRQDDFNKQLVEISEGIGSWVFVVIFPGERDVIVRFSWSYAIGNHVTIEWDIPKSEWAGRKDEETRRDRMRLEMKRYVSSLSGWQRFKLDWKLRKQENRYVPQKFFPEQFQEVFDEEKFPEYGEYLRKYYRHLLGRVDWTQVDEVLTRHRTVTPTESRHVEKIFARS